MRLFAICVLLLALMPIAGLGLPSSALAQTYGCDPSSAAYANAVDSSSLVTVNESQVIGPPDGQIAAAVGILGQNLTLDMGANEMGVGDVTLYHGILGVALTQEIQFLDSSRNIISTAPLLLTISLGSGSVLVHNPDQSTPYRYVRIRWLVAGTITINAVQAANVACQIAPGGVAGGLAFWAKADAGISATNGQAVGQWTNQADGGVYNLTQATASAKPLYYTSTSANLINFNPTLSFDGSNDELSNTSAIFANSSGFQIITVGEDRAAATSTARGLAATGASGNAPALNLQTDGTSPNGWNPALVSSTPAEWTGGSAKLYNGNTGGSNRQAQIFGLGSSNSSTSATDNVLSTVDGFSESTTLDARQQSQLGGGLFVGSSSAGKWNGLVGDTLVYDRQLSTAELQRVQSYLAIKYGITLDTSYASTTTNFDYVDSSGAVIWPGTGSAAYQAYHNNVTGIGRDDASALDQRKSKSVNANGLVTLDNGAAFSADLSYLVVGDNGGATTFATAVSGVSGASTRMARIWAARASGTIGAVRIGIPNTTVFPNSKLLIVSNDGVFDGAGETAYALTNDGTNWSASVNIASGQFFTFASGSPPAAPTISSPSAGSATGASPSVSGLAEAGSTVTVQEGATTLCTALAAANGAWSCTPSSALSEGSHSITATATSVSGTGPASVARSFMVDTTPPAAAPTITSPAAGSSTNNTAPIVTGTGAEANSSVLVKENGSTLCTATADGSGAWSCAPSVALGEGGHTVTASARDAAGNTGPASAARSFTVDTTAPAAPSISSPSAGSSINSTTPSIAGTAEANSSITVAEGASTLCTTTADGSGNWSCTPASALSVGSHSITATARDAAGNSSVAASRSFTIDTSAVSTPSILTPAAGGSTNVTTPPIGGTADAGTHITVREGASTLCTTTADGSGNWSCTPTSALSEGSHTITVVATNNANTSSSPATRSFTIDTTAPAAPSVGNPSASGLTNDNTPAFDGIAEANSSVTVKENGSTLCTTTADGSGNWSCSPTSVLSEGSHTVTATARDVAGNTGAASAARSFTIDTIAPAAPAIGSPSAGSSINSSNPQITGTAELGSNITVAEGASTLCVATADGSGNWSCAPGVALGEGSHTVTATARDAAGNTSAASAARSFTVDTTAPAAPSISSPLASAALNNTQPSIAGTAEANSTVLVKENGSTLCTTTADGSGNWSCTPTSALSEGGHSITASARDAAGNTGPASAARSFTVDTIAPAAPSISSPSAGSSINSTTPSIAGTAEANSSITVAEGASTLCTATADGSGNWSCTPASALSVGSHTLSVTARDAAGNTSAAASRSFTIDTNAVSTPSILTPAAGGSANVATPLIGGTADASVQITVTEGASTLCTTTANGSGNWSCTPSSALSEGSHTVTVVAVNGSSTSSSPATRTFTIDTVAPATAPAITSPADGSSSLTSAPLFAGTGAEANSSVVVKEGATTLCVATADGSGNWSCTPSSALSEGSHTVTASARDAAGNTGPASAARSFTIDTIAPAAPSISSPSAGSSINSTTPSIAGTAEANSSITVAEGASTLCVATADGSGNWSCAPGVALSEGSHTVTASARDAAGNTGSASAARSFTVDTSAPAAPSISSPAAGGTTNNPQPVISGAAEPGSSVTVSDGGNTLCTATADGSGAWSCTPSSALSEGSHSITATARDAAGNTSAASAARSLTIDTTAPAAPAIGGPGASTSINNSNPPITGTAELGNNVTVKEGGSTLCTALVDGSGNWSCTPSSALSEGGHSITASARDAAGNTGPASAARSFTVDTSAPAAPSISSPAAGGTTNSTTPSIAGTAEANSTITVAEGASTLCTATADGSGNWSCTPTSALSVGSHTLSVTARDAAGNTSAVASRSFTIDTNAVSTPSILTPAAGGSANVATPLIGGTADAGVQITVTEGASTLCTTTANGSGNWSCTPSSALSEGSHTVTAVATSGATSSGPATRTFTIDTVAPATAPALTSPISNTSIMSTLPSVSGANAEASSTVIVKEGSTTLCTATASAGGAWSCTPASPLSEGSHSVTAAARDAAGNTGPTSAARTFTVDTTAPASPAIIAPVAGAAINSTHPVISGTAELSSSVTVKEGTNVICSANADVAGKWLCTSIPQLSEGGHTLTAFASDAAGNTSPASTPRSFTVDTTAPVGVPVVVAPPAGNMINDSTPTFEGTGAEPGSTVSVKEGTTTLCTATVDGSGNWSCTPSAALSEGSHSITVNASDMAGNAGSASAPQTLIVDTIAPVAPAIDSPAAGSHTSAGSPIIDGTAEPNSTITVTENGTAICTAVAAANGAWSCTPSSALSVGLHALSVTARDAAGNSSAPASRTFTIDNTVGTPSIQANQTGTSTNDTTPTINGTADPGLTVTVFEGLVAICSTTADINGAWSCTPTTPLSEGTHTFSAVATNAFGDAGASSTPRTFIVDTIAPSSPIMTSPSAGEQTDDTTPTLMGTAEPNSSVTVREGSTVLCTTTADGSGNWSCTPSSPLSLGLHTVTAVAMDQAGNISPASSPSSFSIKAQATVVISSPANGSTLLDRTPLIQGTAAPAATITIVIDPDNDPATNNSLSYQATADAGGLWSIDTGLATPSSGTLPAAGFANGAIITITASVANNSSSATTVRVRIGAPMFLPIVQRST